MSGQRASAESYAPFCSGTAKIACSCTLTIMTMRTSGRQAAVLREHDRTGALQIIALPTVNATAAPAGSVPRQGVFANYADEYLHSLGVPQVWLPTLRQVGSEDELIEVLQKLPQDVAERLCDVAAGRLVTPPASISALSAAAEHADQARNLFVVRSRDDLRPLLDAPMATWIAFCIRRKENSRAAPSMARSKSLVPPALAKRSWPCTGRDIWHNGDSVCC